MSSGKLLQSWETKQQNDLRARAFDFWESVSTFISQTCVVTVDQVLSNEKAFP